MSDNIYMKWWGCGDFDVLMGDVNIAFDPYRFGSDRERAEPIYDYIFISHEHFDHCHAYSLEKLCRGDRFKKLYIPPGCLDGERDEGDTGFFSHLPIDRYVPREKIEVVYPKYRKDEGEPGARQFPGPFELDLGPIQVEVVESDENFSPELPTNGYLVTHAEKDVSFYHTGDLHVPFPALENLRGRVDYLIHMKIGVGAWDSMAEFLDLVEPRFFIPTHYRTDRETDPIPAGQWPPDIDDVNAYIENHREHIGGRTQILPFTAGFRYEVELPAKRVNWKWNSINKWAEDGICWEPMPPQEQRNDGRRSDG